MRIHPRRRTLPINAQRSRSQEGWGTIFVLGTILLIIMTCHRNEFHGNLSRMSKGLFRILDNHARIWLRRIKWDYALLSHACCNRSARIFDLTTITFVIGVCISKRLNSCQVPRLKASSSTPGALQAFASCVYVHEQWNLMISFTYLKHKIIQIVINRYRINRYY